LEQILNIVAIDINIAIKIRHFIPNPHQSLVENAISNPDVFFKKICDVALMAIIQKTI
jgi:hypothetical protein